MSDDMSDEGPSYKPTEFCKLEHISKASWFKMRKLGLAPDVYFVPGTRIGRITARTRREWHQRMAEVSAQEAAQLEAERRQALASRAGKAAVQSERHIVNQRRARRARHG
jgi:hypothetical protein